MVSILTLRYRDGLGMHSLCSSASLVLPEIARKEQGNPKKKVVFSCCGFNEHIVPLLFLTTVVPLTLNCLLKQQTMYKPKQCSLLFWKVFDITGYLYSLAHSRVRYCPSVIL